MLRTRHTQNPSVISSAGAIGKQFNPDGNIGQVGEKIGGPFSKVCVFWLSRPLDQCQEHLYPTVESFRCRLHDRIVADFLFCRMVLSAANLTLRRTELLARLRRLWMGRQGLLVAQRT